jgi:mono/diheme cytochrome c family protein
MRRPSQVTLLAVALVVGLTAGVGAWPASGGRSSTIVNVLAGYPTAKAFTFSQLADLPPGLLVFKVFNRGRVPHSFEICTAPVAKASANRCKGLKTKTIRPGQSATLDVRLTKRGLYEYLSALPGQAAGGMKGLLGVGVNLNGTLPGATTKPVATTTGLTSTTTCSGPCAPVTITASGAKPPAVETLVGDPSVGASLFPTECGSCHALAAAKTTGSSGSNLDQDAPSQQLVVNYLQNGSDDMPSFGGELTGAQINGIAAYVYRSTHA